MLADVKYQDDSLVFLRGLVEGRVTSPLLLVGQEGTGKRFAARQTVQELFCTGTHENACPCVDCLWMRQGMHTDLTELVALDSKDIGVDPVRQLLEISKTYPSQSRYRFFIIDGVDRLTLPAANALLKTLEEPPHTARFLLLAESLQKVLPTIRSRCGLLNFRALPEKFILQHIEKFESDSTKALVYARLGEGSVGRAIQYWGSGRLALRDKALELLSFVQHKDVAGLFLLIDQLEKELPLMLRFLATLLHDLLLLSIDESRLINLDKIDGLRQLKAPTSGWHALQSALQEVQETSRNVKIQLPFHVKAILLNTFEV